jgi:serine/threonine protein kinase
LPPLRFAGKLLTMDPGSSVSPPPRGVRPRGFSFLGDDDPTGDPAPSRAGQVLGGRFELLRLIGVGGMGTVWLASDRQLARPTAIKVLKSSDTVVERRFLGEIEILATVSHPGLVAPIGTGRTADGRLYLAMEYIRGENLRDRITEIGPLGWRGVVEAAIQVADVLNVLHASGVLHRDIKPSNIMLVQGARLQIKLIDLGVAKRREGRAPIDETEAGAIVGTPAYLPPEASRVAADPRLDVYGLAATIYELCTGKRPEHGAYTPMRAHGVDPPAELEAVLTAALAADPGARTPTIEALREGLRRVNDASAVSPLFDGRYELLRRLGAGGKAEVWLAHHRRTRRDVALKLLTRRTDAELARLQREAQVLARLRHPAFPQVYDLHEHGEQPYLVLEHVAGERASKYIEHRLSAAYVIDIGVQLVRALIHAHSLGVLHRDIHNANVLIDFECGPVSRPIVKLIDLGMCELLPAWYADLHRYATPPERRQPLGTSGLEQFAWTAPESRCERVWTEKSDVWSVGLLLYQLLTGHRPFADSDSTPASPRRWVPACSGDLEVALLGALSPDPARRLNAEQLLTYLTDAAAVQAALDEEIGDERHAALDAAPQPENGGDIDESAGRKPAAPSIEPPPTTELPAPGPEAGAEPEPSNPACTAAPTVLLDTQRPLAPVVGGPVTPPPGLRRQGIAFAAGSLLAGLAVWMFTAPHEPTAEPLPPSPALVHVAPEPHEPAPEPAPPSPALARVAPAPARPVTPPDPSDIPDMKRALELAADSLQACARRSGRAVSVELAVMTGATRFTSIDVLFADPASDRCVREILEPLRFATQPAETTFVNRYQP